MNWPTTRLDRHLERLAPPSSSTGRSQGVYTVTLERGEIDAHRRSKLSPSKTKPGKSPRLVGRGVLQCWRPYRLAPKP
jgi:hypothetical protein